MDVSVDKLRKLQTRRYRVLSKVGSRRSRSQKTTIGNVPTNQRYARYDEPRGTRLVNY
jgi:hypothetical protein